MFHAKSFEEYAATRVYAARISRARKLMQVHAALLGASSKVMIAGYAVITGLCFGIAGSPFITPVVDGRFWQGPRTKRLT